MKSNFPIRLGDRISDVLKTHVERRPHQTAVVDGSARLTFADLHRAVNQYARALLASGVEKGDRVATLAPPCADYWIQFLAVTSIGAIWFGINPKYRARDNQYVLSHAEPRIVFALTPFDDRALDEEIRAIAPEQTEIVAIGVASDGATPVEQFLARGSKVDEGGLINAMQWVQSQDIAAITYTSGTTGQPKGAMLSHAAITACADACDQWMGDALEAVVMGAPINHVGALCNLCMNVFYHGGKIVFLRQVDMEEFLRLGEEEKTTLLPLGHTVFGMLLDTPTFSLERMTHGKLLIHGGSKTTTTMLERFASLPADIASVYGQTESTGIVTYTRPDENLEAHANTLGKPVRGVEHRLFDENSGECISEDDGVGELQLKCDFLFSGYFRNQAATNNAFTRDGWLRTGDICKRRADGNYELVDRKKLMFKSGGYNVYPAEVEQAIMEHPAIGEAVVLAMPDERYSQVGVAYLSRLAGATVEESEVREFLRDRIANYKIPKQFVFLSKLPTLPNLKFDRQQLQDKLDARLGGTGFS